MADEDSSRTEVEISVPCYNRNVENSMVNLLIITRDRTLVLHMCDLKIISIYGGLVMFSHWLCSFVHSS